MDADIRDALSQAEANFPVHIRFLSETLRAAQEGVNATPDDLEISELKMSLVLKIFSRPGIKGIHVNSLINI